MIFPRRHSSRLRRALLSSVHLASMGRAYQNILGRLGLCIKTGATIGDVLERSGEKIEQLTVPTLSTAQSTLSACCNRKARISTFQLHQQSTARSNPLTHGFQFQTSAAFGLTHITTRWRANACEIRSSSWSLSKPCRFAHEVLLPNSTGCGHCSRDGVRIGARELQ